MLTRQEEAPELLEVVAGDLVSVEEGLVALDTHKTAVRIHAESVKHEISGAVERQLSHLRAKEKQLLRQVELATTHHSCEVNVTQAQLLQHKGALSVTRTILDSCNNSVATDQIANTANQTNTTMYPLHSNSSSTVKSTIETSINSMPHQDLISLLQHTDKLVRVPLVAVNVEEAELNAAVQNFGKVSQPPSLPHHDLLPHSVYEEYGDLDHHVLYKSLQPDMASPRTIDVRQPYLLAAKNLRPASTARKFTSSPSKKVASESKKEELEKWLHRLRLDGLSDSCGNIEQECCRKNEMPCVEDSCQATETCNSFSKCLMSGQCKRNAVEKIDQTNKWLKKQMDVNATAYGGRKRTSDEWSNSNTSSIKSVLAHMNGILKEENSCWLVNINTKKESNKKLKRSHSNINLGSYFQVPHEEIAPLAQSPSMCKAILYKPPLRANWTMDNNQFDEDVKSLGGEPSPAAVNVSCWLLNKIIYPSKLSTIEEKRNLINGCSTPSLTRTKSLFSLAGSDNFENIKDKIEKISLNDLEIKEQWLLNNDNHTDNKVCEIILKNKEEWLSTVSNFSISSSFDLISNPEYNANSWLLTH